jgi:protein FAM50
MEIPKKRQKISCISFIDEEEEPIKLKKFQSNPAAAIAKLDEETKFLQDLKNSFTQEQSLEGEDKLELIFTYWDGSNIKNSLIVQKKITIGEFLQQAKKILKKDHPRLEKSVFLMFVKENKIIPHEYRFLDLLMNKAVGSKGPLFTLEKVDDRWVDKGYLIKVLERKWYEKNRHIFPASKWTIFEPE